MLRIAFLCMSWTWFLFLALLSVWDYRDTWGGVAIWWTKKQTPLLFLKLFSRKGISVGWIVHHVRASLQHNKIDLKAVKEAIIWLLPMFISKKEKGYFMLWGLFVGSLLCVTKEDGTKKHPYTQQHQNVNYFIHPVWARRCAADFQGPPACCWH